MSKIFICIKQNDHCQRKADREGVKMYKRYINIFKARVIFHHRLTVGICCFFRFRWFLCEGLCSKPFAFYLPPDPGITQDRTCCLNLAPFWQFGSLPISYADLEMKSIEWGLWRDDIAVSPPSWQSWSFNAPLPLLRCQSSLPPTDNWRLLPSPNCVS